MCVPSQVGSSDICYQSGNISIVLYGCIPRSLNFEVSTSSIVLTMDKLEIRAVITYFFERLNCNQYKKMSWIQSWGSSSSNTMVKRWIAEFEMGRTSTTDAVSYTHLLVSRTNHFWFNPSWRRRWCNIVKESNVQAEDIFTLNAFQEICLKIRL